MKKESVVGFVLGLAVGCVYAVCRWYTVKPALPRRRLAL